MSFNEYLEKDPQRCRELRKNERKIKSDHSTASNSLTAAMNEIKDLRDKRGKMKDKEKNLQIAIAGATIASGMRGAVGHVLGGGGSSLSTELAVLQSRIDALEADIVQLESHIDNLKNQRRVLARNLTQNSAELTRLNCVT